LLETALIIGAQSFMLSTDVVRIFIITVNAMDYSTDLRQLNILDELDPEDHIIATYNLKAAQGVLPEPALMSQ
jgi:hypothetical protein